MTDSYVLRTLRAQAWARAKGEMSAMLDTFWCAAGTPEAKQFETLFEYVTGFIKTIDDNGMVE